MDIQRISVIALVIGIMLAPGCGGTDTPEMVDSTQLDEERAQLETDSAHLAGTVDGIAESVVVAAETDTDNTVPAVIMSADADAVLEPVETPAEIVASENTVRSASDTTNALSELPYKIFPALLFDNSVEISNPEFDDIGGNEPVQDFAERQGLDAITDLLFLTGQSNAASLSTKYDAELDSPDERVFAYTDQGWQVADLHQFWDKGIPGNFSVDDAQREPFNNIIFQVGKALARSANRSVGIVMLTAPGKGISHWDHDSQFYSRVRRHALAALNALPHKSSFDAVVWMQGETDWLLHGTADPDVAQFESNQSEAYLYYYPRKLTELIGTLRTDPWFGGEARFICTETIKAALNPHLMGLNSDGDALTGCAAASDLAAREDDPHGNHFSGESLRVLGQRIADVYLALQP